jgi:hypothetical protein
MEQEELYEWYRAVTMAYFEEEVSPETIQDRVLFKLWGAILYTELGRECPTEFVYGK